MIYVPVVVVCSRYLWNFDSSVTEVKYHVQLLEICACYSIWVAHLRVDASRQGTTVTRRAVCRIVV